MPSTWWRRSIHILYYDIMPDEDIEVTAPDVLILEGLNVLAPSQAEGPGLLI